MNSQNLRDAIFAQRPKYNSVFKPLIERISNKGDVTGKGDFTSFGPIYQTFMYAYIIGLHIGIKTPLLNCNKIEFAAIQQWKPDTIRDFIIITLLNRTEEFSNGPFTWQDIESCSEERVRTFIIELIRAMEEYANTGFEYLQKKWDTESYVFSEPFAFADILQDLCEGKNIIHDNQGLTDTYV